MEKTKKETPKKRTVDEVISDDVRDIFKEAQRTPGGTKRKPSLDSYDRMPPKSGEGSTLPVGGQMGVWKDDDK